LDDSSHALTALDELRLQEALLLAEGSFGLTEPNPRVGCVLGFADGRVIGKGATQQAGGPHAEVMALRDAHSLGHQTHGATAWVTLEPCAHHGRTPPCCDALIASGLRRVVVAAADPFLQVNGAGLDRLRTAGIEVALATGELARAAREINIGFFSRVERGTPWVRMKVAASVDGCTALANGQSQWITGEAARRDGHLWRRRASAVLTGIGTALADDPRLDVRAVNTAAQPMRVVVDSQLRLPPTARLLQPPGQVLIFTARSVTDNDPGLLASGALVVQCTGEGGHVDLKAMLYELAKRGVNEVHVEAGATLNGALLQEGLVDELLLYLAPSMLGQGRPMAQWPSLPSLSERLKLQFTDLQLLGDDIRIRATVQRPPVT
jgi:diaminohydroxyphosphoribosylaminopyrimidine deaminase / 5-amino-6-(5-phosphoribosylamino)uracil reductase